MSTALKRTARPTGSANADCVDWQTALAVAVGTSLLFMLGYGGVAQLTSLRDDIGTWYYDWERFIPFVPIMIVPYMSIDLLFVLAPFTCTDRKELRVLAQRLSAVVIAASICFLIYPLQLAVPRPQAEGFFGEIYNGFTRLDRPYNLCPSMHIALRTVLAAHFGKHCRGIMRIAMNLWFCLIGCSTLLLYQHHVIDVVGGFVLAVLVMYVFDGIQWRLSKTGGFRFATAYAAVAGALAIPVLWFPKLGWLTLWPAAACVIVAGGYAYFGPAIYRRVYGRLTWPAKLVLGPVLLGQWLSWKYYAKRSTPITPIVDGVCIGRYHSEREAKRLTDNGIAAVVDVCVAFDEPDAFRKVNRLELPILDLTAPTADQVDVAVDFIERNRERGVLVHCKAGYSRSAALVAVWLVRTGRAESPQAAFELLRAKRPQIVLRPEIRRMTNLTTPTMEEAQPCLASTI